MSENIHHRPLAGQVALVAGATRGAGRAIAIELSAAGATVYATGRSTRGNPSPMARSETIEETAELVDAAGGHGIAVRVDHGEPRDVAALVRRIAAEQEGRLDILVNDVWGGDPLTRWRPFWEHDLDDGLQIQRCGVHTHLITSWHAAPLMIARGRGLIVEITDGVDDRYRGSLFYDLAKSGVIRLALARGIAALASDPDVMRKSGRAFGSWHLGREYGVVDVDGSRPDWGEHFEREVLPHMTD